MATIKGRMGHHKGQLPRNLTVTIQATNKPTVQTTHASAWHAHSSFLKVPLCQDTFQRAANIAIH